MKSNKIFSLILLTIFALTITANANTFYTTQNTNSPDFKIKGFHIDLRIQVMTIQALKDFAIELADFGINTIVMEWEAAYPYEKHVTISNDLAYTREEIKEFIDHCQKLGIDVIPLQQCFGHVEYILRNDRYIHLKEDRQDISQVCPLKTTEDSILFAELFTDMASMHPSEYIHIGGDETRLLGHCKECAKKVEEEGKSKLFVDYMKMMCNIVTSLGKKPVMWADIVLSHPEAANELPEETIFVDWNYGWNTNYFGNINELQEKGLKFWGAPALRSHPDNWYVTDWEKHINNLHDFIPYSRKADYEGMIMTSWSTSGLYGFVWDVGYEPVDMIQIRNTYPLSGFRFLVAAYAQSLNQQEPLNQKEFVLNYTKERFGFNKSDGEKFWEIITIPPELISEGKPTISKSISDMQATVEITRKKINELNPTDNKKEFEHFRLMLDLRAYYLAFKKLEAVYNSKDFTREDVAELLPKFERLFVEAKKLDIRFAELNKGFITDAEIEEQNFLRNQKLNVIYNKLKANTLQNTDERKKDFPQKVEYPESLPSKENLWIFIMAGQSNMAGRGIVEPRDTIPNKQILTLDSNYKWIYAKEPLHFYQPKISGLDCGLEFGRTLIQNIPDSITIALIPTAIGGSSVKQWLNDSLFNGVQLYSNFKSKVEFAENYGTIKGILWHQGETDAMKGMTDTYKESLEKLFQNFRQEVGDNSLPIIMGEIGQFSNDRKEKSKWNAINSSIHEVAKEDGYSYVVRSNELKGFPNDPAHFTSESQRILGKRYATMFLNEELKISSAK